MKIQVSFPYLLSGPNRDYLCPCLVLRLNPLSGCTTNFTQVHSAQFNSSLCTLSAAFSIFSVFPMLRRSKKAKHFTLSDKLIYPSFVPWRIPLSLSHGVFLRNYAYLSFLAVFWSIHVHGFFFFFSCVISDVTVYKGKNCWVQFSSIRNKV